MVKNIKNLMFWSLLALYVVFYIIGTAGAIIKENIAFTAMFFSGFAFVGGLFFGRWTVKKENEEMEKIRESYSIRNR